MRSWRCTEENNFFVIEDCAQAHGSSYKGRRLGSITHVGTFSFCQDKIMTTGGEGGMLICNDHDVWSFAWSYKDHGKSWSAVYEMNHADGYRWLHESFGTNWRMTEMQAAIGRVQLKMLPQWSDTRCSHAMRYNEAARGCSAVTVPHVAEHLGYVPYKHYIYVNESGLASGWNRDRIVRELNNKDVPCLSGTCSEAYLEGI